MHAAGLLQRPGCRQRFDAAIARTVIFSTEGRMHQIPHKLITASVVNFCEMSGLGRSKVYELLDAGDLASIKIGKRRLIVLDSYHKLIERQRAAGATTRTAESSRAANAATENPAGMPRRHQNSDDPHPHPPWAGKATPIDSKRHHAHNKMGKKSSARRDAEGAA
jgi:hypothetical protein